MSPTGEGREELLPCPFCGKAANIDYNGAADGYIAWCHECLAGTAPGDETSRADAVAAWNRRAGGTRESGLREAAQIAREHAGQSWGACCDETQKNTANDIADAILKAAGEK